jgi:cell division protein FtsW
MFVAVGLFPVTGQTLPFVSQGGTSNIITGITFGIILNISREAVIEMKKSTPEEHPITQETVYVE